MEPPGRPPSPPPPAPESREGRGPGRGVLNELARGFLLELKASDAPRAARFASQFLAERSEPTREDRRPRVRAWSFRSPLPRASSDGRSLEPP